jgi:hypothetical protein
VGGRKKAQGSGHVSNVTGAYRRAERNVGTTENFARFCGETFGGIGGMLLARVAMIGRAEICVRVGMHSAHAFHR